MLINNFALGIIGAVLVLVSMLGITPLVEALNKAMEAGVDRNIYRDIIRLVHAKGEKVLLDEDGELFRNSLEAVPDIIKPNRVELDEVCKKNRGLWSAEAEKILFEHFGVVA